MARGNRSNVTLRFGGGLHTRASEEDINPIECSDGVNFDMDPINLEFRPREEVTLLGRAPNNQPIQGFASFINQNNEVFLGVQAGSEFYRVNIDTSFTKVGDVNANSRMRGSWRDGYWSLGDKILITDMALQQGVYEWDGTTLQEVSFKKGDDTAFGFFSAKYLKINRERAIFSNVRDASGNLSQLIVGSAVSDYTKISVADRPSTSLGIGDPFFIPISDLRDINGEVMAFGRMFFSTKNGSMWQLTGENSQEFSLEPFYEGSNASGEEAVVWAGNDVYYGKIGTIDSLKGVAQFGDVEATAISNPIKPSIQNVTGWTAVYNDRKQRAYFFASGSSDLSVLHKSVIGSGVSPWSRWKTTLPVAFQPTCVMSCLCPITGCERVYMGDNDGNIYMLDGANGEITCKTVDVTSSRTSRVFRFENMDANIYNVTGYMKYRKQCPFTAKITFLYGGISAFDENLQITSEGVQDGTYWSDTEDAYWGGFYWTRRDFRGRLTKQRFFAEGGDDVSEFQIKVEISGAQTFAISEIFCEFEAIQMAAA